MQFLCQNYFLTCFVQGFDIYIFNVLHVILIILLRFWLLENSIFHSEFCIIEPITFSILHHLTFSIIQPSESFGLPKITWPLKHSAVHYRLRTLKTLLMIHVCFFCWLTICLVKPWCSSNVYLFSIRYIFELRDEDAGTLWTDGWFMIWNYKKPFNCLLLLVWFVLFFVSIKNIKDN